MKITLAEFEGFIVFEEKAHIRTSSANEGRPLVVVGSKFDSFFC